MNEVTIEQIAADQTIPVIDVREDWEWNEGHVPHAKHIPLDTVLEHLDEIPDGAAIICKSGGRSARVVAYLESTGRTVSNVTGGTDAWKAAGQPVATGE